jgi:hypothetical protein
MIKNLTALMILSVAWAVPALAAGDPTVHEIYEAAQSGNLARADQMMNQVLRDHPQSAKAHFVAAELSARERNLSKARQELATAESLEPGLGFAKPESVRALKAELSGPHAMQMPLSGRGSGSSFPAGSLLIFIGAIALLWFLFRRRRSPPAAHPQYPGGGVPAGGAPMNYGGPGAVPGAGIGSGIAGGLASGLAVGAGVVAGEELARHFLDSDRREGHVLPPPEDSLSANEGIGGQDFGVTDGNWDDGGAGGGDFGGGGDDWS